MKKRFYITTPIYYPSGKAHIGHSYTTVATDAIARFKRLCGYDVMFLTGTDEHGQKIELKAAQEGITPQEYVDKASSEFKRLWKLLGISNDYFIRTTDTSHKKAVQKMFRDLYDKGEIYKDKYQGWYCTPCESFWVQAQLENGKCPDCGREVYWAEEEAYFFKLSSYADKLLSLYSSSPDFIQPESRKNEMIQFIKSGLEDICVSRTSFKWGVLVDFDETHVVYVWLDALMNYITALGYASENSSLFEKFWPADVHFVGKEIVRFHAVIWPAVLMALELPLPKQIYGHGWLLFGDGTKMSKSKGNVVDPYLLCERYGVDAIRYFLLREIPFGSDGLFTNHSLITRINTDLANDLGNLVSRISAMVEKYFSGKIPAQQEEGPEDEALINCAKQVCDSLEENMQKFQFSASLADIWQLIAHANRYIEETTPWNLAKSPENTARLARVLYNLCEGIRVISVLLTPFMPETARLIQTSLAYHNSEVWDIAVQWGGLPQKVTVCRIAPLFPRIDLESELRDLEALIDH